jgi:crotonobetainyl-CoA:carnitine CoA-transferase CaiB-like acyl-CoA transferase
MIFEASDGFLTVGANSDKEWKGLCEGLDRPDWLADPRFATQALRSRNRQARLSMLEEVLRENTVAHWLDVLDRADVPCAPVLRRQDIADHPQVIASESIETIDHPGVGDIRLARPAARFEKSPAGIRGAAPYLGEHTREVLEELGYSADMIAGLTADGAIRCREEQV